MTVLLESNKTVKPQKTERENMDAITVHKQTELDKIPVGYNGLIQVDSERIITVTKRYKTPVHILGKTIVTARNNASVEAHDSSSIEAHDNSSVFAYDDSYIKAYDTSSIYAYHQSYVNAADTSLVIAYSKSHITACGNSCITACQNSFVDACEHSVVVAKEHSFVSACGNSSIEAWDNSFVEAHGNNAIEAHENSYIEVYKNNSVTADGNSQIMNIGNSSKIKLKANAREITAPLGIENLMAFYSIKNDGKTAIFYKAVHKHGNVYIDGDNPAIKYEIGQDYDVATYIGHKSRCIEIGCEWNNLAVLETEVDINNVILPIMSLKNVYVSQFKILREIPLENCGILGKNLMKRKEKI